MESVPDFVKEAYWSGVRQAYEEFVKTAVKKGKKLRPGSLAGGPSKPSAKAPAGEGSRFKALTKKLKKKPGVYNPEGLAAAIGRAKFKKKKFQQMAAKGK